MKIDGFSEQSALVFTLLRTKGILMGIKESLGILVVLSSLLLIREW